MRIVIENDISLADFDAWSGAVDTLDVLIEKDLCEQLEDILEDLYPDGMSDTALNDFLWFERDAIADWLDFSDWEELENGKEEDEKYTAEEAEEILNTCIENGDDFETFCCKFFDCPNCPFHGQCDSMTDCKEKYYNLMEADEN